MTNSDSDTADSDVPTVPNSAVEEVAPDDVGVDPMNERTDDDAIDTSDLEASIDHMGVIQPPLVREADEDTEFDYTAVVGQRRILAAQNVGLDSIPVIVMDWSDEAALKASITENINLFSQNVPMSDRAAALKQLWEIMGGSGMPVQSHLGAELGVPRETVRTWLEPLHDGWKDTSIDPDSLGTTGDELGEKGIAIIRRMTGGGEEGEACVEYAEEHEMTQDELKEAKTAAEDDDDLAPLDALKQVVADRDSDSDSTDSAASDDGSGIEANVKFDSDTSVAVSEYAEEHDKPPAIVIVDAVQWFLSEEGYLDE